MTKRQAKKPQKHKKKTPLIIVLSIAVILIVTAIVVAMVVLWRSQPSDQASLSAAYGICVSSSTNTDDNYIKFQNENGQIDMSATFSNKEEKNGGKWGEIACILDRIDSNGVKTWQNALKENVLIGYAHPSIIGLNDYYGIASVTKNEKDDGKSSISLHLIPKSGLNMLVEAGNTCNFVYKNQDEPIYEDWVNDEFKTYLLDHIEDATDNLASGNEDYVELLWKEFIKSDPKYNATNAIKTSPTYYGTLQVLDNGKTLMYEEHSSDKPDKLECVYTLLQVPERIQNAVNDTVAADGVRQDEWSDYKINWSYRNRETNITIYKK